MSGDTWNVNPIALRRIDKLLCKNERAVIRTRLEARHSVTLVPVAAILVASIRLNFITVPLPREAGRLRLCDAPFAKGRRWVGSSTAQLLLCWRPQTSRCAKTSARAAGFVWESRSCGFHEWRLTVGVPAATASGPVAHRVRGYPLAHSARSAGSRADAARNSNRMVASRFGPGKAARRDVEGCRRLRDRLAVAEALAHGLDHLPAARDHLQRLGDVPR